MIAAKLDERLKTQRIWQDLRAEHGFASAYDSVKQFVRRLGARTPLPFRRMECGPGEEVQIDFGVGALVIPADGTLGSARVSRPRGLGAVGCATGLANQRDRRDSWKQANRSKGNCKSVGRSTTITNCNCRSADLAAEAGALKQGSNQDARELDSLREESRGRIGGEADNASCDRLVE